jgi:hypothetical protein
MPSALEIVDAIGRALERLRDSADADDRLLAAGASAVLRGRSFDEGVELADGWLRVVRHRDQERALVAIAATLGPGKANGLARQIEARLSRYYSGGWLRDSLTHERPDVPDGLLYDYLNAGGPVSAESIRKEPALVKFVRDLTSQPAAA